MSSTVVTTTAPAAVRETWRARALGYWELTKPRIAVLELLVVFVAAMISSATPPPGWVLLHTLMGTALIAASASAFNQILERRTDSRMSRTAGRPLPSSLLQPVEAAVFASGLLLIGALQLAFLVNLLVATLGVICWALYVLVYTPLKTRSTLNTVVGAVAGAIPALMGAAATGSLGMSAVALFTIIYLWQFPHFMAIAWLHRDDYASGGMKMLTVVDPSGRLAGRQAVVAALVLIPVAWIPISQLPLGMLYAAGVTVLGMLQAAIALRFATGRDDPSARRLLRASLIYLPGVLLLLLLGPMFS